MMLALKRHGAELDLRSRSGSKLCTVAIPAVPAPAPPAPCDMRATRQLQAQKVPVLSTIVVRTGLTSPEIWLARIWNLSYPV